MDDASSEEDDKSPAIAAKKPIKTPKGAKKPVKALKKSTPVVKKSALVAPKVSAAVSKPLEANVAKITDEYIKKEIEANKVGENETSEQISEKISHMKRLMEDLAAKAEHAAS